MDKYETLSHYFGYTTFREGQEALIDGILAGNDVVGIMPTGAGKSICYQVPALMLPGITLVISPLISLMKDQVGALVQSGVRAAFINSTLTPRQSELALSRAAAGQYKIVYVAPERLQTSSFLAFAQNAEISLVVVDEAHCVSQWGQNFRPSYLHIEAFVAGLPRRPVTAAFTATATGKVRADIIRLLGLRSPAVTTTGFDRANLYFEVRKPKDKFAALTSYLSLNRGKSGIVYCATRKLVEEVTDRLLGEGWQAGKYHAGMSDSERNEVQEKFIRDEIPLIVATNAFGMGIDKSNVSFVIHYNMPKNMESYYQEAGRAGRDGQPADCVLLYSGQDVRINTFLIERTFEESSEFDEETAVRLKENELELLKQMTFYSTSQYCFRKFILKYFGEHPAFENCGNCSNCMGSRTDTASRDITVEAQKILSCVRRMNESQTKWVIIDILRGTRNNRVEMCGGTRQSTFGIMRETGSRDLEKMIDALVADKYLTESHDGLLGWGSAARGVIYSGMRVTYRERQGKPDSSTRREDEIGRNADPELFARLRELRREVAQLNGVPPFVVFSDASLRDMAEKKPTNEAQFRRIYGVGEVKTGKFGRRFLDEIAQFLYDRGGNPAPDPAGGASADGQPGDARLSRKRRNARKKPEKPPKKPRCTLEKDADGRYILPTGADPELFAALRTLCYDLASDYGIQSPSLASIHALADICVERPATEEALARMGILPSVTLAWCGREIVRQVRQSLRATGAGLPEIPEEAPVDERLLERLLALRAQIHERIFTPANRIISDTTLRRMSAEKPLTRTRLREELHLSDSKCMVFGRVFLRVIRDYAGETQTPDGYEGAPEIDNALFEALAALRHEAALRENKTDLTIMSDATLYDICLRQPRSEEDFRMVYGIGEEKAKKYGAAFVACVSRVTAPR